MPRVSRESSAGGHPAARLCAPFHGLRLPPDQPRATSCQARQCAENELLGVRPNPRASSLAQGESPVAPVQSSGRTSSRPFISRKRTSVGSSSSPRRDLSLVAQRCVSAAARPARRRLYALVGRHAGSQSLWLRLMASLISWYQVPARPARTPAPCERDR